MFRRVGSRILYVVAALGVGACGSRSELSIPNPERVCVVAGDGALIEIEAVLAPQKLDVVFVVDATSSMQWTIAAVREAIASELVPVLQRRVEDVEFGVAEFRDFEVGGPPDPASGVVSMTRQVAAGSNVDRALSGIRLGGGGDAPEAQVEALVQVMTGRGVPSYIHPAPTCPQGRWGGACFRADALPLVLLFTNGPMHNGPRGRAPYDDRRFVVPPAHYEEALELLRARGVVFVGFWSEAEDETLDGLSDLRALAEDLDALNDEGKPLVFDTGEDGEHVATLLAPAVDSALDALIRDLELVVDDPNLRDGDDAATRVERVRHVSWSPSSGAAGDSADHYRVYGVTAGTRVKFQIEIGPPQAVSIPLQQRLRLRVGTTTGVTLAERTFDLVDAGADPRCTTYDL